MKRCAGIMIILVLLVGMVLTSSCESGINGISPNQNQTFTNASSIEISGSPDGTDLFDLLNSDDDLIHIDTSLFEFSGSPGSTETTDLINSDDDLTHTDTSQDKSVEYRKNSDNAGAGIETVSSVKTVRHPVAWKIQNTPGFRQPTIEPYKSDLKAILQKANSTSKPSAYYQAFAYQITGNTNYANKSVARLLAITAVRGNSASIEPIAVAYDWLYQTKNVNSTLNNSVDAILRRNISVLADRQYKIIRDHEPASQWTCAPDDYYLGSSQGAPYPSLATAGVIMADYRDPLPYNTTPAMWEDAGEGSLFTFDPIGTRISRPGMLYCTNDYNYGLGNAKGFLDYGYTAYYDTDLFRWFNVYQNAKGQSIFQKYPGWEGIITGDVWSNLPNRMGDNTHDSSLMYRSNLRYALALLDKTNRSNVLWHRQQWAATKGLYPLVNDPTTRRIGDNYLMAYNFSNETPFQPPQQLNTLRGFYNVIRSDWSDRADWLSFIIWNYPNGMGQFRTSAIDTNQLAIQYYSHGDFLIPAQSDVKYLQAPANSYYGEILENGLMFGRYFAEPAYWDREWFGKTLGHGTNTTLRTMQKAKINGDQTPALSDLTIDNDVMTAKRGTVNISKYHEEVDGKNKANDYVARLAVPISYSRTILYPKDYFVIVDRASSATTYDWSTPYFLGSLNVVRSKKCAMAVLSCISPENAGHVNGILSIGGKNRDWLAPDAGVESEPVMANYITWDTTNLYNEKVNLKLFTVPKSNITYQKMGIRLGTKGDSPGNMYAPRIYINTPQKNTLYRISVLLTKYDYETAKIPAELAVSGTGSAMQIKELKGDKTDYIYTGTGTSSFSTFQTDADTVFIRKSGNTLTDFTLINATFIKDNNTVKFRSITRVPAVSYNSSLGLLYPGKDG
jgi:hypothetical protein